MEEKVRSNTYVSKDIDDALADLSEKTKISKNSLVNLAISKLLLEFGVIDFNKEAQAQREVIKSTDYCDLLKQGRVVLGDYICTMERILVKGLDEEEIRFAYYKLNKNNNERLILRPLDISENELLMLFADAINKKVFSSEFQSKLKAIL